MSGLKLLGHPLHAAIVHFPVAAWTATAVTDTIFVIRGDPMWWHVSQWLLIVGIVTALAAMTAGFIDLIALPPGEPAQKLALRHMYFMSSAWTIYLLDLLVRLTPVPGWLGLAISGVGFLTLLAGTHLGAQLVYDLGVGQTGKKLS
ncbi:MAG TPA: DUF2231 domain-containing protein [Spirochaetia bacterium]|nr:DUF2231 domain-containing protein [Spirochaetia bacterium]